MAPNEARTHQCAAVLQDTAAEPTTPGLGARDCASAAVAAAAAAAAAMVVAVAVAAAAAAAVAVAVVPGSDA